MPTGPEAHALQEPLPRGRGARQAAGQRRREDGGGAVGIATAAETAGGGPGLGDLAAGWRVAEQAVGEAGEQLTVGLALDVGGSVSGQRAAGLVEPGGFGAHW